MRGFLLILFYSLLFLYDITGSRGFRFIFALPSFQQFLSKDIHTARAFITILRIGSWRGSRGSFTPELVACVQRLLRGHTTWRRDLVVGSENRTATAHRRRFSADLISTLTPGLVRVGGDLVGLRDGDIIRSGFHLLGTCHYHCHGGSLCQAHFASIHFEKGGVGRGRKGAGIIATY